MATRSRDPGEVGEIGETDQERRRASNQDRERDRDREKGRERDQETQRDRQEKEKQRQREGVRAPSQAVTELAQPEGGVSLECSQLGESQAALEIWGREGRSGGK